MNKFKKVKKYYMVGLFIFLLCFGFLFQNCAEMFQPRVYSRPNSMGAQNSVVCGFNKNEAFSSDSDLEFRWSNANTDKVMITCPEITDLRMGVIRSDNDLLKIENLPLLSTPDSTMMVNCSVLTYNPDTNKYDQIQCTQTIKVLPTAITTTPMITPVVTPVNNPNPSPTGGTLPGITVPDAPTAVSGTAEISGGRITLTFQAPANDGGSPITGYEIFSSGVKFNSRNYANHQDIIYNSSSAAPYTFTKLTGELPYYFKVQAINGVGKGTFSDQTSILKPVYASFKIQNIVTVKSATQVEQIVKPLTVADNMCGLHFIFMFPDSVKIESYQILFTPPSGSLGMGNFTNFTVGTLPGTLVAQYAIVSSDTMSDFLRSLSTGGMFKVIYTKPSTLQVSESDFPVGFEAPMDCTSEPQSMP